MNDYISRQAAIEKIHSEFDECLVWDESGKHTADEVERILDRIPPADVRPVVRGRWIVHYDDIWPTESTQECPECHEEVSLLIDCKFCPMCGADMKEVGEDG